MQSSLIPSCFPSNSMDSAFFLKFALLVLLAFGIKVFGVLFGVLFGYSLQGTCRLSRSTYFFIPMCFTADYLNLWRLKLRVMFTYKLFFFLQAIRIDCVSDPFVEPKRRPVSSLCLLHHVSLQQVAEMKRSVVSGERNVQRQTKTGTIWDVNRAKRPVLRVS